jgi:hypothetical protein
MKPHRILKTFKGSQNGHDHHEFMAGTTRDLSRDLAAIVVKEGWAEPHTPDVLTGGPHPKLEVDPDAPNELVEGTAEEKSEGPAPENKMKKAVPENKKAKK